MIIESSAMNMRSNRNFASVRRFSSSIGRTGILRSGSFVHTAVSAAQTAVRKDSLDREDRQELTDSNENLMARFSQSRSIKASRLESNRNARSIHTIRRQSIGYLLHQFFWRRPVSLDPISALLADQTSAGSMAFSSFDSGLFSFNTPYAEMEQTNFSTEGTVVTASGQEINFNVELSMSRSFYEQASTMVDFSSVKLTDPLVINLDTDTASVSDQKFYFDLDADGHAEQISRLNAGSGFLALDKNGDGVINNGSELFGAATGNGFSELAQYDQDGNGWIDEADEIFDQLLIWQKDDNGNDVLRGLGAAGVGAIYLGSTNTNFSLNSAEDNQTNAVIRQTGVFLYENGGTGTVQQVDFAR